MSHLSDVSPAAQSKAREIAQHNAITTARYDYTSCQLDIIFYLLSKLKRDAQQKPIVDYQVVVREIEHITGRIWNYQQLRTATEDMGKRMFEVNTNHSYKQIWMFQQVEYVKGTGRINIQLSEAIVPYLFDLKNNFTTYQLHSALKLSSKFAKRIYQICSQWKDIGLSKTLSLYDFKVMLKLIDPSGNESEQFEKLSAFKAYVLEIAKQQINEHTDLKIDYQLNKSGRSVNEIQFHIARQLPKQMPIPFEGPPLDEKQNQLRVSLKEIGIVSENLIQKVQQQEKAFYQWWYDYKTGKITVKENPAGHLLKTLGLV